MQLQPSPLQRNEKPVKLSKNLVTEQIVTTVRRLFPPATDLFLVSHRFLLLFSSCPPLLKMLPTSTRVFFFYVYYWVRCRCSCLPSSHPFPLVLFFLLFLCFFSSRNRVRGVLPYFPPLPFLQPLFFVLRFFLALRGVV